MELLIAFKVSTLLWSGFVEYMTSKALSPSSWVKPIINPERYCVPPKPYCEVVEKNKKKKKKKNIKKK